MATLELQEANRANDDDDIPNGLVDADEEEILMPLNTPLINDVIWLLFKYLQYNKQITKMSTVSMWVVDSDDLVYHVVDANIPTCATIDAKAHGNCAKYEQCVTVTQQRNRITVGIGYTIY